MYKGGEDDGNVEGCSHYYYRQSSHDQDIEKYNWNYCHLVSFDYDLGYKTASVYDDDYDRFENHTVGIAKCHEHRAPWCDGCNYGNIRIIILFIETCVLRYMNFITLVLLNYIGI